MKRGCMFQNLQKYLLINRIHREVQQEGDRKNLTNCRQQFQFLTDSGICFYSNYELMKTSHLTFFFLAVTLIMTHRYQISQSYATVCFHVTFLPYLKKNIEAFRRIREKPRKLRTKEERIMERNLKNK